MTEPGNVLDLAPLGVRVEILKTAAQTDGESLEIEVVGRARGLLGQSHVHARQVERLEVPEGALELRVDGREHRLGTGEAMEVPPARRTASARALKGLAACASRSAQRGGPRSFCAGWRRCRRPATSCPEAGRDRWPAPRWCSTSPMRATPRGRLCASRPPSLAAC